MSEGTLVTALEETWSGLLRELGAIERQEDWHLPTPCSEWSVRDLASHLGAIESQFQGLSQPAVAEPPSPTDGIEAWTAWGVAARRDWSTEQILDEVTAASASQLERLRGLDETGWQEPTVGPTGETSYEGLALVRLVDLYVHLLDLRRALGRPLRFSSEPAALARCVARVVDLTPWAAVKRAELPDGTRVRLDLGEPGAHCADLVVKGGRGSLSAPEGDSDDRVVGAGAAYLVTVAGREVMVDEAGGIGAEGSAGRALLDRYRLFG